MRQIKYTGVERQRGQAPGPRLPPKVIPIGGEAVDAPKPISHVVWNFGSFICRAARVHADRTRSHSSTLTPRKAADDAPCRRGPMTRLPVAHFRGLSAGGGCCRLSGVGCRGKRCNSPAARPLSLQEGQQGPALRFPGRVAPPVPSRPSGRPAVHCHTWSLSDHFIGSGGRLLGMRLSQPVGSSAGDAYLGGMEFPKKVSISHRMRVLKREYSSLSPRRLSLACLIIQLWVF